MEKVEPRFAQPADVYDCLAGAFDLQPREVMLYARFLREDGRRYGLDLWPAVTPGRGSKFEISKLHAAHLLIALATSPAASNATERTMFFGKLIGNGATVARTRPISFADALAEVIIGGMNQAFATLRVNAPLASITGIENRKESEIFRIPKGMPFSDLPKWMRFDEPDYFDKVKRTCELPSGLLYNLGLLFKPLG